MVLSTRDHFTVRRWGQGSSSLKNVKTRGPALLLFMGRISPRNIGTTGLVAIRVAGECVRAGTRTSTDLLELALSALAFEGRGVAQSHEKLRLAIDRLE